MAKTAAEREQAIASRKQRCDERTKLWIMDDWSLREVWRVPLDALLLNVDNRRFAAERLWAEDQLGHSLDPENRPEDELCIESLLLDKSHRIENGQIVGKPSRAYEALRNDWDRRNQESPFWIRPDGTVRNGNRRLAMIKRVQREKGDSGLAWVDAVILDPEEIDEAALLEMEQREQLTENFKVRYNDIDYLLALREAAENREIDWFDQESMDEVAGKLQTTVEKTKPEVVRDLYAIKYMDLFLEDSGQGGQYHKIPRTLEVFRDIGRMMITVEADYPDDFDKGLKVLFATVRARKSYGDIRQVRQMFARDRDRFERLAGEIGEAEDAALGEERPVLDTPNETSGDDENGEEDDGGETGGASVASYPKKIGRLIDVAIDGFQASRQSDVLKTLKEVTNRLESLDEGGRLAEALEDTDDGEAVRAALTEVIEWAEKRRALLSEND